MYMYMYCIIIQLEQFCEHHGGIDSQVYVCAYKFSATWSGTTTGLRGAYIGVVPQHETTCVHVYMYTHMYGN